MTDQAPKDLFEKFGYGGSTATPTQTPTPEAPPVSAPQAQPKDLFDKFGYGQQQTQQTQAQSIQEQRVSDSIWLDPGKLISIWQDIQTREDEVPDVIKTDIEMALSYYQQKNADAEWWNWQPLAQDDPLYELFASMGSPIVGDVAQAQQPEAQQPQLTGAEGLVGMTPEEWDSLPAWQKVVAGFFSQPGWVQGVGNALPWAMIGAAAGLAAGPVGSVVGAIGLPILMGGAMGAAADPETYNKLRDMGMDEKLVASLEKLGAGAVNLFNVPSEILEQWLGTSGYLYGAAGESLSALPELIRANMTGDEIAKSEAALKAGKFGEMLDDLPAVWEASRLTYEMFETQFPVVSNIPAAIQKVFVDPWTDDIPDAMFAKPGEVHMLGEAMPVELEQYGRGLQAMVLADIKANPGKPARQIVDEYREMLGFSATAADFVFQSVLDPLNAVPAGERVAVGAFAVATKNAPLKLASEVSKGGVLDIFTNTYKQVLRSGLEGAPLPKDMTPFQRKVAGVTDAGLIKELSPAEANKGFLRSLNDLTPEAKADATQNMMYENQQVLLESANTREEIGNMLRAWAGDDRYKAQDIAKLLDMPEFTHMREAMREFVDVELAKLEAMYDLGEQLGYRDFIYSLADSLGENPSKVLSDFATNKGDMILNRMRQKLSDNPEALRILEGYTSKDIGKMVSYFKDKSPLTAKEYKAIVMDRVLEHSQKWSIDYYGVKAKNKLVRTTMALKSLQSLALLGVNPKYVINNVVNNMFTRMSEGLFGFRGSADDLAKFVNEWGGTMPSRLEGFGAAGETGVVKQDLIREAMRVDDGLQKFQDAAGKVGGIGPMTKLAGKIETKDVISAKYYALKQTWASMWNNDTIPKLPDTLSQRLNTIDPNLSKVITAALQTVKKNSDINVDNLIKTVDNAFANNRAERYIGDISSNLGIDATAINNMLETIGVTDFINKRIEQGMSMPDAVRAARKNFEKDFRKAFNRDLITRAEEAASKISTEGYGAALREYADLVQYRDETMNRHTSQLEEAWATHDNLLEIGMNKEARAMLGEVMERSRQQWKDFNDWEATTWKGMLETLGFKDANDAGKLSPNAQGVVGALVDNHKNWNKFYVERDKLWSAYAKNAYEMTPAERVAAKKVVRDRLAALYKTAGETELAQFTKMGDAFSAMWDAQGLKGLDQVQAWWNNIRLMNEKRFKYMTDLRDFERGIDIADLKTPEMQQLLTNYRNRRLRWSQYYKDLLLPLYAEYARADLQGITDVFNAASKLKNEPPRGKAPNVEGSRQSAARAMNDAKFMYNKRLNLSDYTNAELAAEGWFGGRKALLDAFNEGRSKTDRYQRISDMPADEALDFMRNRLAQERSARTARDEAIRAQVEAQRAADEAAEMGAMIAADEAMLPELMDAMARDRAEYTPDQAAGPFAMGTQDTVAPVQYDSMHMMDGWQNYVDQILDEMSTLSYNNKPLTGALSNLDEAGRMELNKYLAEVSSEYRRRKRATLNIADKRTEMALLNYSRKYNFDTALNIVFPYQFWYTRSMMNWGARMIDRPAWFSMYYRTLNTMKAEEDNKLMPYRMRGTLRIPLPFLPEETGQGVYVDPWGKIFPFHEFQRPIDNILENNNRTTRKAESLLYDMAREGVITPEQLADAVDNRTGEWWDMAFAQAKNENGQDMFDLVGLVSSPALYLSMPFKFLTGQAGAVGELPMTRFLQGLSGATGYDWTQLDVLGKAMRGAGVQEFGEWGNYYIERQLTNMVMDGKVDSRTAIIAMMEQQGEVWEQARQLVLQEVALKEPGMLNIIAAKEGGLDAFLGATLVSWLPGKLLPKGELESRGLNQAYQQAWKDYKAGDIGAVDRFFDDHPEYAARTALYTEEPEERLRKFIQSEIWDRYTALPALQKKQANEMLGDDFMTYFLDDETRDMDAVDLDTMVKWSKMLGGYSPAGFEGVPIEFNDPAEAQVYETYIQERDRAFPEYKTVTSWLYSLPEERRKALSEKIPMLQEYYAWQEQYAANHPDLIPFIIKEDSNLQGVDPKVQQQVYLYNTEKDRLFPTISQSWNEYYALPAGQARRQYWSTHPELERYIAWKKDILAEFPGIEEYITYTEPTKGGLSEAYTDRYQQPIIDLKSLPPSVLNAMYDYFSGEGMTAGVSSYLRDMWESQGRPQGSFQAWIESLRNMFANG